jgi:hypothetical protein
MNKIPENQNMDRFQRVMRAKSQIYVEAVRLQVLQFAVTVVLPVMGACVAVLSATTRPYVAFAALFVTVLDVLWLDRSQRQRLKTSAKMAEAFDCGVLELPWNGFAAGKPVDAETIDAAARAWKGDPQKLLDWYPKIVGSAPLHLARIICQRTNLWYDSRLRRRYGKWLVIFALEITLLLFIAALAMNLSMLDFVAVITTASPVLIWAIRENFRQADAADAIEILKGEAETLFERAKTGQCGHSQCEQRSREFQDAIFARRAMNPLIFPLIYRRMRPEMELQMNAGAEALLSDLIPAQARSK